VALWDAHESRQAGGSVSALPDLARSLQVLSWMVYGVKTASVMRNIAYTRKEGLKLPSLRDKIYL
jgi:hypothetical protein